MPIISKEIAIKAHYPIGKYFIQTVLIPDKYSKAEAVAWLEKNKLKHNYHRSTHNYNRYMQHSPVEGAKYYTDKLPNGIDYVYQKYS